MNTKEEIKRARRRFVWDEEANAIINILDQDIVYQTPLGEIRIFAENYIIKKRLEKITEQIIKELNFG